MNEIEIRKHVRLILAEIKRKDYRLLKEQEDWTAAGADAPEGSLKAIFIEPFTDVFKVAGIVFADIATGVVFNVRGLLTFNVQKKKQLEANYKASREKYQKALEPIMNRIDKSMNSDLMTTTAFMLNPSAFIAKKAGAGALAVAGGATKDVIGALFSDAGKGDAGAKDARTPEGPLRGLMSDLRVLFFGENAWHKGELIVEQEQETKAEVDVEELQAELQDHPEIQKFNKLAAEMIEEKQKQVNDAYAMVQDQFNFANSFLAAKTLEDLQALKSSPVAAETNIDEYITKVQSGVDKKMQELSSSENKEDFFAELRETEIGKDLPANPEEEPEKMKQALESLMFGQLKENAQDDLTEGRSQLMSELMEVIADGLSPAQIDEVEKSSPQGEQWASLIKNFWSQITSLN